MRAEKDKGEKQQIRQERQLAKIQGQPLPDKALTSEAKAYIKQLSDDPNVSPEELAGITKLMREHPEAAKVAITKSLQSAQAQAAAHLTHRIKDAQLAFIDKAKNYVDLHLNATRAAYAAGEFDVAARHAEWAIEKMGTKNLRLIEVPDKGDGGNGGPRIMVGVKIGGQQTQAVTNFDDDSGQ